MRVSDLRDWQSCLNGIRQRLDYAGFESAAQQFEEDLDDHALALAVETDEDIAEGMLHTVVTLLQPEEVSSQLEQFAAQLERLQVDPTAVTESGPVAKAYRRFFSDLAQVRRGLPAVVETFKAYCESRCSLDDEPLELLREARSRVQAEPQVALRLVGEAGCLCLQGLYDVDNLSQDEGIRQPKGPLTDWIESVASVVGAIAEKVEEYPLGEVELARDQWRAPDDKKRIEYKKGKLARLGIVGPELQSLLLPLLKTASGRPSRAEWKAIVDAGAKVVPGLVAIAGDHDSQLQGSISGGQAAITAVQLLGDMRAAESVPTLLDILKNNNWMTIIYDQALQVLQDRMPDLAFDSALVLFDRSSEVELKSALAGVLAKGGKGKPGVFERLIDFFRNEKEEQGIVATYLADLGDPRALPDLHQAFGRSKDSIGRGNIEEAIIQLGGELTAVEKQKSQRLRTQVSPAQSPGLPLQGAPATQQGTVRVTKIGRNETCPCGSGKKYKKCCRR